MSKETEIATLAKDQTSISIFNSVESFELAQRICKCLSNANMLPKQYNGEAGFGNCIIAFEIAQRAQLPVMEVFQNLYIVNGKTSWSAQYLIGRVNNSPRFNGLRWESENEGTNQWRMRAKSVDTRTGEELVGEWVSLEMAQREKWGAKWQTMPGQMLRYRSAAFWVRVFAPDIAMGVPTQDEVEDIEYVEVTQHEEKAEKQAAAANALRNAIGKKKPVEPQPVVSIVVEEEKPNAATYESELEKAKRNLGIDTNPKETAANAAELPLGEL